MSFVWNGVSSDTMKFNVTSRQVYNAPAFDLNAVEVPGRSGDLLNPQNRFKNKQVTYTGFLKASDFEGSTWREKLSTGLIQLKGWLCSDAGNYHELTDDYDPGFTRYGYISGETAISDIEDRPFGVTLTVTFNCKPFMYMAGEPMELPETKSASGSIITITDGAENTPLKSAVVNIEPVQDLHGYDSPWPAGGGKNVCPPMTGTTGNGLTSTVNSDGSITITGTATGTGGYITGEIGLFSRAFSAGENITISTTTTLPSRVRAFLYNNGASVQTIDILANGSSVTTTVTADADGIRLYLFTTANTTYNFTIYPQVEHSATASAWSPYSNICPISGWTQVSGKHSGADMTDYTPINIPLGQTVYGGTLDVVRGKLNAKPYYASYSGQTLVGPWISSHDKYVAGATPTTGAQVVDMGAAGTDYDVTPQTIKTLLGVNNIWADAGSMEIEYPVPTENPYPFGSRPLYEITMDGTGTLAVNGREWTISDYTGTLYCDTEAMEWYDASQLRNNIVSGDGWPVFDAGENSVSYTGDITKVMVTPRWRTL